MYAYLRNSLGLSAALLLLGTATALDSLMPGYNLVDMEWEVQAFPQGPKMKITGTVEQIYAELVKMNPNFNEDFGIDAITTRDSTPESSAELLSKRFGPICGSGCCGWREASAAAIGAGISYLRGVSGQPTNGAGPGNCGRVSCSNDAAIYWCNDNTTPYTLPSFNTIADCAQVIVNACQYISDGGMDIVVGQNFNGGNWNCIVRADNC